ncbi:MAG: LysM peptidoglycan-binding domain-containing protein, partial [Pseudomonadota bacterium]
QSLLVTSPGANGFAQPAPVFNANPVGQGYHTVQRGDTLYSISRRFGVTVSDLARLNNLRKPYLLKVGQVLRVASSNVTISSVASPAGAIPYQVKSGDTMYSIASMFGTTREQLGAWNGIPSPYTVQPGQWLNIYRAR